MVKIPELDPSDDYDEFAEAEPKVEQPESSRARKSDDEGEQERVDCPACGERIAANAVKCRFCGEAFGEPAKNVRRKTLTESDKALLKSFRRCSAWSGGLSIVAGLLFVFLAFGFYTKSQPDKAPPAQQMPRGLGPRFNRLPPMGAPAEQKPAERNQQQNELLMVAIGVAAIGLLTLVGGIFACLKHRWALVVVILMSLLIPAPSIMKGVFAPLVVYGPVLILASLALKRSVELSRCGVSLTAKVIA